MVSPSSARRQYFVPTAWANTLEGVLDAPAPLFWNITKN